MLFVTVLRAVKPSIETINARLFLSCATAVMWLLAGPVYGGTPPFPLGHRGFSHPKTSLPMPRTWINQPVQHPRNVQNAHLLVTLNQQSYAILLPIIQRYARTQGLNILVRDGHCGESANLLLRKQVDMAGYCCPPGEFDRLPGLQFHTLGIAAIALMVHPDNPIQTVSLAQARDIFRGRYFRWSELTHLPSTPPHPIQTIGRLHCKLRPGHWRKLLDHPDLFSPRMKEVDSSEHMVQQVANNINAIGYETIWNIIQFQGPVRPRPLAIDGFLPQDNHALSTLRYPFYRVFGLAIWEGNSAAKQAARQLVAHLVQVVESLDKNFGLISAARLQQAGWRFHGTELVGEPATEPRP